MIAFPSSRRALLSLGLPAVFALAACGEDSTGVVVPEFDPTQAAETVDSVFSSIDGGSDALASLELAGAALASSGAVQTVLPAGGSPWRLLPAMPTRPDAIGTAALPIFPSNILGKTFVYDAELGRYEIDGSLTGAPENGVRFIYYAIDPVTRRPATPLNALGYLELTDESGAASMRIGIAVVNTAGAEDVTLIDYFIDASYTETATTVELSLAAEGFLSDGTKQVDFDLNQSAAFTDGSETIGIELDHTLSLASEDVTVHFVASGELLFGAEDPWTLDATMTVVDGSNTAVVEASLASDGTVDGTMTFNDRGVAVIGGTLDEPTITTPTGGNLTAQELLALKRIWEAAGDVMSFGTSIFSPFSGTAA